MEGKEIEARAGQPAASSKLNSEKACINKEVDCEIIQALQRMSALAREIFALSEQEVPTMRKS